MEKLKSILLLTLTTAAVSAGTMERAWAGWDQNGTAVCTAAAEQSSPSIIMDYEGGAIVTWRDNRSGDWDIYAQRVDGGGRSQWTADGVALCTEAGSQWYPTGIADGAGGAIVVWRDQRSGNWDLYAQLVGASGSIQWAANGIGICTAANDQVYPVVVPDGTGGAIMAWQDERSGSSYDIYVQRVDADGDSLWPADGVGVCLAGNDQERPTVASDGLGGAIVSWQDYRAGNYDIYVQRVDANGDTLWGWFGIPLCTEGADQKFPAIVSDGTGGAIVAWQDYRSGGGDWNIYAQRVTAAGIVQWTGDGVALCTAPGAQERLASVSDGVGGAIVTWNDPRSGFYDVYAQRIDASGAVQWTLDGVALCTAAAHQEYPAIVPDDASGAIVTWSDQRAGNSDVYAQRIDASGSVQWVTDGVGLCADLSSQLTGGIACDGAGGALVTWQDFRSGNNDIYAQRVTRQGYWGYPAPEIISVQDVSGDQGGRVRIRFNRSRLDAWPDTAITQYSTWRALSPDAALYMKSHGVHLIDPSQATADLAGKAYYSSPQGDWELVGTMEAHLWIDYGFTVVTLRDSTSVDPAWEYFRVSAHGGGTFDFWNSPLDSGYSVDNLPPGAPLNLELSGPHTIAWRQNTEEDLAEYMVYVNRDSTGDLGLANRVGATTDTAFVLPDTTAGYYALVTAKDVHGNESEPSNIVWNCTGIAGSVPPAYFLARNVPNPFNPLTTLRFGILEPGHVTLSVHNLMGRPVAVLVDGDHRAGEFVKTWDGRDESGRAAASGIYFARLQAGDFVATRKMVLLR